MSSNPKKFNLKEEQAKLIEDTFELYAQKTGKIDYHELKLSLKAFGFDNKNETIKAIKAKLKTEDINFDQFKELMEKRFSERKPMEEAKIAFDLFRKGKQTIGPDDLFKAIQESGDKTITLDDVKEIIKEFGAGNQINQEQFLKIMKEYYYEDE